jgi:hypothetical protein
MEAGVDGIEDEELLELIRQKERHRHTKKEEERRERQANTQLRYRLKLKKRRAPARADFAAVTFTIVLLLIREWADDRIVKILRAAIVEELVDGDFDRNEILIRLDRMLEDCAQDLPKWRHARRWNKDHEALVARALGQAQG